jgi:hypothetical protein
MTEEVPGAYLNAVRETSKAAFLSTKTRSGKDLQLPSGKTKRHYTNA